MANRPAVPMVIGVLMIIFATLALGASAFAIYGLVRSSDANVPVAANLALVALLLPDVIVGCVELAAGIGLVGYKAAGPVRAMHFAIMRIVATIAGAAFVALQSHAIGGGIGIVSLVIGLAWPVIVLALLGRLRQGCDAPASKA